MSYGQIARVERQFSSDHQSHKRLRFILERHTERLKSCTRLRSSIYIRVCKAPTDFRERESAYNTFLLPSLTVSEQDQNTSRGSNNHNSL